MVHGMDVGKKSRVERKYLPCFYAIDVEVDEPREAVLVHGVDVWEVGNGEEQCRGMAGYWSILLP